MCFLLQTEIYQKYRFWIYRLYIQFQFTIEEISIYRPSIDFNLYEISIYPIPNRSVWDFNLPSEYEISIYLNSRPISLRIQFTARAWVSLILSYVPRIQFTRIVPNIISIYRMSTVYYHSSLQYNHEIQHTNSHCSK